MAIGQYAIMAHVAAIVDVSNAGLTGFLYRDVLFQGGVGWTGT